MLIGLTNVWPLYDQAAILIQDNDSKFDGFFLRMHAEHIITSVITSVDVI